MRRLRTILPILVLGVLSLALVVSRARPAREGFRLPGPRTLPEAAERAGRLGLYCRSDAQDGRVRVRLVVSEAPLTWEEANYPRLNDPDHPSWAGRVTVSAGWRRYAACFDPAHAVVWGELFVFGDRAVIEKLIDGGL